MNNPVNDWSDDIDTLLERVRRNCVYRENYHRKNFFYYQGFEKYFQIPLIILSALNSVISVGLTDYTSQRNVSLINCMLSLTCGIISSIELYLTISVSMETELKTCKQYYALAIDIYKTLHLPAINRSINGKEYLEKCFSTYNKLCDTSQLLVNRHKNDQLTEIVQHDELDDSISTRVEFPISPVNSIMTEDSV